MDIESEILSAFVCLHTLNHNPGPVVIGYYDESACLILSNLTGDGARERNREAPVDLVTRVVLERYKNRQDCGSWRERQISRHSRVVAARHGASIARLVMHVDGLRARGGENDL